MTTPNLKTPPHLHFPTSIQILNGGNLFPLPKRSLDRAPALPQREGKEGAMATFLQPIKTCHLYRACKLAWSFSLSISSWNASITPVIHWHKRLGCISLSSGLFLPTQAFPLRKSKGKLRGPFHHRIWWVEGRIVDLV